MKYITEKNEAKGILLLKVDQNLSNAHDHTSSLAMKKIVRFFYLLNSTFSCWQYQTI